MALCTVILVIADRTANAVIRMTIMLHTKAIAISTCRQVVGQRQFCKSNGSSVFLEPNFAAGPCCSTADRRSRKSLCYSVFREILALCIGGSVSISCNRDSVIRSDKRRIFLEVVLISMTMLFSVRQFFYWRLYLEVAIHQRRIWGNRH